MRPRPDPTHRFADRVADYERGRPGYPAAILDALEAAGALRQGHQVVDLGAGTGLSSEPFLARGYAVTGVEPNEPMRRAAEIRLAEYPGFRSVSGRAEATGLPAASVDLLVAAQAFHWFDGAAVRAEALRIVRPGGHAALIWNARRATGTPFLAAYEALLLEFGTDYREVGHRGVSPAQLAGFFGHRPVHRRFASFQSLDAAGLRARLLSSSYTPGEGDPRRAPMLAALDELFAAHAELGRVTLHYDTDLHFAPLRG